MSSSEYRRQSENKKEAKEKTNVKEEKEKEEPCDKCEGSFPASHYPPAPGLEEQVPDDLPRQESQEQPQEDEWFCLRCDNSPCLFIQWQKELQEVTIKAKRYHMYCHMSQKLHGHLGKGNCRPLYGCFQQGLMDLFPSEEYMGFKPSPFQSGPRGDGED
jgi:hypothetical protein